MYEAHDRERGRQLHVPGDGQAIKVRGSEGARDVDLLRIHLIHLVSPDISPSAHTNVFIVPLVHRITNTMIRL
jgi:hypothetical protein